MVVSGYSVLSVECLGAFGADAMGKGRLAMLLEIFFNLDPVSVVVADFLAMAADGKQLVQLPDLAQRLLQLFGPFPKHIVRRDEFLIHRL